MFMRQKLSNFVYRYDMAMQCLLENKINMAIQIVLKSNLVKQYPESYLLLGDCFIKRNEINLALKSYLKCRKKMRKLNLPFCQKTIDLAERIIDILNDKAEVAINNRDSKRALNIAEQILQIFDEDKIPLEELRLQRSRALIHKTRGLFQIENKKVIRKKQSCEIAADSLRFARELNPDLYQVLYNGRNTEGVIDRFAPQRKLPRSLKILMQFS